MGKMNRADNVNREHYYNVDIRLFQKLANFWHS